MFRSGFFTAVFDLVMYFFQDLGHGDFMATGFGSALAMRIRIQESQIKADLDPKHSGSGSEAHHMYGM
jgi:hypothetical protein